MNNEVSIFMPAKIRGGWIEGTPSEIAWGVARGLPIENADLISLIAPTMAEVCVAIRKGNADWAWGRVQIYRLIRTTQYLPGGSYVAGPVTQFGSEKWINATMDVTVQMLRHTGPTDLGILPGFPAFDLRVNDPKKKEMWRRRWVKRGGTFHEDRMVALVGDSIWEKLNRFGHNHPPFDFNDRTIRVRINRREALRLGLLTTSEPIQDICRGCQLREARKIPRVAIALK